MVGRGFFQHMQVHRPALLLVTRQQGLAAPALKHGGKLPAQVHRVTDTHVHAKSAKGWVQVASVAGQKHATVPVLVGHHLVGHPFVHTERLKGKIQAGGLFDQRRRVVQRDLYVRCQPRGHEKPAVAGVHRAQQARHIVVDQPVHDGFPVLMRLCQSGRPKHDVVVAGHAKSALHARANRFAHAAAATITTGQKLGLDFLFLAGFQIAHAGHHRGIALFQFQQFGIEANLHTRQAVQVFAHHLLQGVLRDPLGVLRVKRVAARRAVQGVVKTRQLGPVQARGENDVGWVIHPKRRGRAQRIGNAPAAQMLARAHIGGLGARRHADARIFLDDNAVDAAMAKFYRQALADRACAHNQDLRRVPHDARSQPGCESICRGARAFAPIGVKTCAILECRRPVTAVPGIPGW